MAGTAYAANLNGFNSDGIFRNYSRWGNPQDIGKLTVFLCSDDSSYITGTDILVDGGWNTQ